jgi:hypothetical protein
MPPEIGATLAQRSGAERVLHVVEGGVPKWECHGYELATLQPVS